MLAALLETIDAIGPVALVAAEDHGLDLGLAEAALCEGAQRIFIAGEIVGGVDLFRFVDPGLGHVHPGGTHAGLFFCDPRRIAQAALLEHEENILLVPQHLWQVCVLQSGHLYKGHLLLLPFEAADAVGHGLYDLLPAGGAKAVVAPAFGPHRGVAAFEGGVHEIVRKSGALHGLHGGGAMQDTGIGDDGGGIGDADGLLRLNGTQADRQSTGKDAFFQVRHGMFYAGKRARVSDQGRVVVPLQEDALRMPLCITAFARLRKFRSRAGGADLRTFAKTGTFAHELP